MLKRPLVFVAVLFVLGIFLAAYSVNFIITVALCIAVWLFVFFRTKKLFPSFIAVLLIILGIGRMGIAETCRDSIIAEYTGKSEVMTLTITDFSEKNSVTAYFEDRGKRHKVLLRYEADSCFYPGDIIEGQIPLFSPSSSKIFSHGYAHNLAGNGIFLISDVEKLPGPTGKADGILGALYSLRVYIDSLGEKYFSGDDDRGLFNAMVIGDKRLISDDLDESLKASGLSHIAVVSGLHLSVAMGFLIFVARLLVGKRRHGYILAYAGALLIVLLTGAGASVIRAFIMCTIFLLSKYIYRDNDSPTALSIAVFIMTLVNPFTVFNAGFILSVLSVAGILIFNKKISGVLSNFMPSALAEVVSMSISAQLTVMPAIVYYFGMVTPWSLLSNALLVPLSGIYVILGMIFIITSPIQILATGVSFIMKLFSLGITSVSDLVRDLPFSVLQISDNYFLFIALWMFLLVLIYMYPITRKNRHRIAASFSLVAVFLSGYSPVGETNIFPVYYGQQMMSAVKLSDGNTFLVDCPKLHIARTLHTPSQPYSTVVLTTQNTFHILLYENHIDTIIASDPIFRKSKRNTLLTRSKEKNIDVILLKDYQKYQLGNAVLEYIPVYTIKDARLLKVYYDGKTYLFPQGYSSGEISGFYEKGLRFKSDYVVLPYMSALSRDNPFTGEILK